MSAEPSKAERQTAAGVRVEQGRTYFSNIPASERTEPISAVSFPEPRREQARRAAGGAVETTRTALKVGRAVGRITKQTLTTKKDPYERIREYDLDIELARRKRRLEDLNRQRPSFRIRRGFVRPRKKKVDREIERLRLEVGRLKAEIRRLRA